MLIGGETGSLDWVAEARVQGGTDSRLLDWVGAGPGVQSATIVLPHALADNRTTSSDSRPKDFVALNNCSLQRASRSSNNTIVHWPSGQKLIIDDTIALLEPL